ncbi:MAG: glycosyltransferase [Acidobacteriota bacterium]
MSSPINLAGLDPRRVALVHDWLITDRGGERVLDCLCRMFPEATLFTLFHVPGTQSQAIEQMRIRATFIARLPYVRRLYRHYLPLFPRAIESLDLRDYDLVLSSSHCVAKGVKPREGAAHLSYCHTPMRYAYDQFDDYFPPDRLGGLVRLAARVVMGPIRRWDIAVSSRVGCYVANSMNTAERIQRCYGRDSIVLHPPVDTDFFTPAPAPAPGRYLLSVSALVPYKRIDRAIAAAGMAGWEYVIVGEGPERPRLEKMRPSTARFLGRVSQEELRELYRACAAFVLPGEEDLGIAPIEAQACGRPVVALRRGGALETVIEGVTGLFAPDEDSASLAAAIDKLAQFEFNSAAVRRHSLRFSKGRFEERFADLIASFWNDARC